MVGVGYGKAREVPTAISKGVEDAKKNFFKVPRVAQTIPHTVQGEAAAGVVLLRPATPGTGVIAGGSIRTVLELAGIKNVLAKRLGKKRLIAETGAGQHGVATATAAALMGMECVVYMGEVDTERQALNVARMRLLGAEVHAVKTGSRTLKDAINDAMRDWVANVDTTHYLLGTVAGPHPFPLIVRDFHSVIGTEAREQMLELTGALPTAVTACVGGGSNAMGIFHAFLDDPSVRLVGYEAAGDGVDTPHHAATISRGKPGMLHGARSLVLQDEDGQTIESHSISAGLDYPGIGPEHAWLASIERAEYVPITDDQAMQALRLLSQTEGIIPAIETAHALAGTQILGQELGPDATILVSLSGRGDKDMETAARYFRLLGTSPEGS